jgi:hypothetical protein
MSPCLPDALFADPRVGSVSKGYAPGTAPWMQAIDEQTNIVHAISMARGTGAGDQNLRRPAVRPDRRDHA